MHTSRSIVFGCENAVGLIVAAVSWIVSKKTNTLRFWIAIVDLLVTYEYAVYVRVGPNESAFPSRICTVPATAVTRMDAAQD